MHFSTPPSRRPNGRASGARRAVAAAATIAAISSISTFATLGAAPTASATDTIQTAPAIVAAAATGAIGTDDAIACPVPSGSEFIDSWGAARSGGRAHQGVDMIADRGTPVVAAQSGDVTFKQNSLGGNAAWLYTESGHAFYYAHFASFEGESRFVLQGEVIGYVGSTGNAQGPHLHFETHFDGSVGNPYPATYDACVQPQIDALNELAAAEAERLAVHGEFKIASRSTTVDTSDDVAAGTTVRR